MRSAPHNLLLAGLNAYSRDALTSRAETVDLHAGDWLHEVGESIEHAYFPVSGAISIALSGPESFEVGVVGYEGMLGLGLILDSPIVDFRARVQAPGRAWRIETEPFKALLASQPELRTRMNRYAYVRLAQMAQDIACRNSHPIESRLARQLLMARDRARSSCVALTHETLAGILGVRRAGVTLNACALQRRALVRYSRGDIHLLDLSALRATSCACYAAGNSVYARVLEIAPE